jgi:hypothetical protein
LRPKRSAKGVGQIRYQPQFKKLDQGEPTPFEKSENVADPRAL